MARDTAPRVLQKSIRYPTYQLYAFAANAKETADNQLIIGALSVLEWLRTKFREFEIPDAFRAPSPDSYLDVSLNDLKSAHIDCGYTVETVSIPEEKVWAFRLIEPDLSTQWKDGVEISTAIPGRVFETNIAFRVIGTTMHMGVELIVSEPESTSEENRAIVLRPAVVSVLARNPKLGLSAGYSLEDRLWEINSKERHKQLRDNLTKWMIPAVVFCDYLPKKSSEILAAPKMGFNLGASPLDLSAMLKAANGLANPMPLHTTASSKHPSPEESAPYVPYDTELFTKTRLSYVHSFHLPADQFDAFGKIHQINVKSGDILFMEPSGLGAGILRFPYSEDDRGKNFSELMTLSRDYMRKKSMTFPGVVFLSGAKIMLSERYKNANMSIEDTIKDYEGRIQALREEHRNELMERNDKIQQQANKITRLRNQLDNADEQIEVIRSQAAKDVEDAHKMVADMNDCMEYLKSLPKRPKTPQEVPDWVQNRFAGRLEFHQRAVRLIQNVAANDIDMQLLCDAIEYLAVEYRDLKAGILKWDDVKRKCSEKYGRPFTVTGCGETSIEMYSNQYKIKYKAGFKGKPVETPLDEHLKVGNTAGNLIRIYFLYDDERKVIVVGSLPHHLKVAQIQS